MEQTLLDLSHDQEALEEKAIRRSDQIRAKFGSLAKFIKVVSDAEADAHSIVQEKDLRACPELKVRGRAEA